MRQEGAEGGVHQDEREHGGADDELGRRRGLFYFAAYNRLRELRVEERCHRRYEADWVCCYRA